MTPRKEVMKETESRKLMQFRDDVKEEYEDRALLEAMQKMRMRRTPEPRKHYKACFRKSRDACTPLIQNLIDHIISDKICQMMQSNNAKLGES